MNFERAKHILKYTGTIRKQAEIPYPWIYGRNSRIFHVLEFTENLRDINGDSM